MRACLHIYSDLMTIDNFYNYDNQVCYCNVPERQTASDLHNTNQGVEQPEVPGTVWGVPGCGVDDGGRHNQSHCILPRHDHRGTVLGSKNYTVLEIAGF